MMGYATCADDLRRGHDVHELRTGDLGRFDAAGNLEIVGRLNRFVKLHGKRIDLDHLERRVGETIAEPTKVTGDDDGIVVAIVDPTVTHASLDDEMRTRIGALVDVPAGRVLVVRSSDVPTTPSGKVDGPALVQVARELDRRTAEPGVAARRWHDRRDRRRCVRRGVRSAPAAHRLVRTPRRRLVHICRDVGPARIGAGFASARLASPTRRRTRVAARASPAADPMASLEPVGRHECRRPHARHLVDRVHPHAIFRLAGGAHALLAVAGYNVARFQLLAHDLPGRARRAAATVARVAVPASAWIGLNMMLAGGYSLGAVLLVNNYTGSGERTGGRWEYWYFEAFVQIMVVLGIVFAIRRVRRTEQAQPFLFALGVLALSWLFRFEIVNLGGAYNEIFRPHTVACFVALGWCAQRASSIGQKSLVSVLAAVTTLGYFETVGRVDQLDREVRILVAVLALVWIRSIRIPTPVAVVVGKIAAASMWIFLLHWQLWPVFTPWLDDRVAYVITVGVGVVVWWVVGAVGRTVGGIVARRRLDGRSTSNHVSSADTAISSSDATPVSA